MFIARQSNHIEADITRNWSSWNYGESGFAGTYSELQEALNEAIESDGCFSISGFELYGSEIKNADIRELYEGYWVLVDTVNGGGGRGIFGIELAADELEAAIVESADTIYCGDGVRFDATDATLVYSNGDVHIFEIED